MPVPRPAFFISLCLPASLPTNKIHPTTPMHYSTIAKLSPCFPPYSPGSKFNIHHSKFIIKHRGPGCRFAPTSTIQNPTFNIAACRRSPLCNLTQGHLAKCPSVVYSPPGQNARRFLFLGPTRNHLRPQSPSPHPPRNASLASGPPNLPRDSNPLY